MPGHVTVVAGGLGRRTERGEGSGRCSVPGQPDLIAGVAAELRQRTAGAGGAPDPRPYVAVTDTACCDVCRDAIAKVTQLLKVGRVRLNRSLPVITSDIGGDLENVVLGHCVGHGLYAG